MPKCGWNFTLSESAVNGVTPFGWADPQSRRYHDQLQVDGIGWLWQACREPMVWATAKSEYQDNDCRRLEMSIPTATIVVSCGHLLELKFLKCCSSPLSQWQLRDERNCHSGDDGDRGRDYQMAASSDGCRLRDRQWRYRQRISSQCSRPNRQI